METFPSRFAMLKARLWMVIFIFAAACTCGARTECTSQGQISLLTDIHDGDSCTELSGRGVLLDEAAKLLVERYNDKTAGQKLAINVLDTCGGVAGALKAAMKTLVVADVSCLRPPNFLGIIGPDSSANVEAVQQVTSVLKIPHLVRKAYNSAFLHHLEWENISYVIQGVFKVIKRLKWTSFTLVSAVDDDGIASNVQIIAKKIKQEAIARKLCVVVSNDENQEFMANIVHVGEPDNNLLTGSTNSTILVVTDAFFDQDVQRTKSSNTLLLLEDDRNDLQELPEKIEKSKWWTAGSSKDKYQPAYMREARWLQNAINIFGTALDTICTNKKCKAPLNPMVWDEMLSMVLNTRNAKAAGEKRSLKLSVMSSKSTDARQLGKITVANNLARIMWRGKKENDVDDDDDDDEDAMPEILKDIRKASKKEIVDADCLSEENDDVESTDKSKPATRIIVTEMDDAEWWTMVGTVSGVGVAMFVVGILAVYVVYTNIRGPRIPKGSSSRERKYSLERDTSLHRVGSDRESAPSSGDRRSSRPQRHHANSMPRQESVCSQVSDRSV